ncbi:MAG: hypothetical protein D6706_21650 [Chloroflexi bacterium]|nr:MAG: hypothetical protein D6706_21650 [Chloroflexota bacterium]
MENTIITLFNVIVILLLAAFLHGVGARLDIDPARLDPSDLARLRPGLVQEVERAMPALPGLVEAMK